VGGEEKNPEIVGGQRSKGLHSHQHPGGGEGRRVEGGMWTGGKRIGPSWKKDEAQKAGVNKGGAQQKRGDKLGSRSGVWGGRKLRDIVRSIHIKKHPVVRGLN